MPQKVYLAPDYLTAPFEGMNVICVSLTFPLVCTPDFPGLALSCRHAHMITSPAIAALSSFTSFSSIAVTLALRILTCYRLLSEGSTTWIGEPECIGCAARSESTRNTPERNLQELIDVVIASEHCPRRLSNSYMQPPSTR